MVVSLPRLIEQSGWAWSTPHDTRHMVALKSARMECEGAWIKELIRALEQVKFRAYPAKDVPEPS
jgi:hypothetical protein